MGLKLVVWEITDHCNLSCSHCYKRSIQSLSDEFINHQRISVVTEALKKLQLETLVISGGEPLLKFDMVLSLLDNVVANSINVILTTNGLLLTEEKITKLFQHGLRNIQISLDGHLQEVHEKIRGKSTFDATIRSIKTCIDAGLNVTVMTVPDRQSVYHLSEMVNYLSDIGVKFLGVERYYPHKDSVDFDYYTSQEYLKTLHEEILKAEKIQKLRIHCNDPIYQMYRLRNLQMPMHLLDAFGLVGCSAAITSCVISADGSIRPCTFMGEIAGNLHTKTFEEIWAEATLFHAIRNRKATTGKCAGCKAFSYCKGCLAQCMLANKTIEGSDLACYL